MSPRPVHLFRRDSRPQRQLIGTALKLRLPRRRFTRRDGAFLPKHRDELDQYTQFHLTIDPNYVPRKVGTFT